MFSPHDLQKSGEINVLQIKSCENFTDLFTKSLPNFTFHKYVHGIGMRRLRDLQVSGRVSSWDILVQTSHYVVSLCEFVFQVLIKDFYEELLDKNLFKIIELSGQSWDDSTWSSVDYGGGVLRLIVIRVNLPLPNCRCGFSRNGRLPLSYPWNRRPLDGSSRLSRLNKGPCDHRSETEISFDLKQN